MLNSGNAQSKYVHKAAVIEDQIRAELLAMRQAKGTAELIGRQERIQHVLIPQLLELNEKHFNNSPAIAHTIVKLNNAIARLDHAGAWECFLALAERPGNNFGTWAI